jgi:hypothetical protein
MILCRHSVDSANGKKNARHSKATKFSAIILEASIISLLMAPACCRQPNGNLNKERNAEHQYQHRFADRAEQPVRFAKRTLAGN